MGDEYILVEDESLAQLRAHSQWAQQQRARTEEELQAARRRLEEATAAAQRLPNSPQEALQAEQARLQQRLGQLEDSLRREIEEQNARLCREIEEIRARQARADAAVDDAARRVQAVAERFDREFRAAAQRVRGQRERAQFFCDQLEALLEGIAPLHPEKLTPGRAEPLWDSLRLAGADLDSGDCQAAIAVAQAALPEAAALLGELERRRGEYQRLSTQVRAALEEVRRGIRELQDRAANAKTVQAEGGGLYRYDGDIAFWSGGLFGRLCAAFEEDARRAGDDLDDMALDRLREAAERLPLYLGRLQRCRAFAEGEFLLSCGVQELALAIYNALTEDGSWELIQSGFQDGDPRLSYTETFQDALGNTAAAVVQPGRAKGDAAPSLTLDACGGEGGGMRTLLREALLARLAACGVDVSSCGEPAPGRDASAFVREACARGARLREERVAGAYRRINL